MKPRISGIAIFFIFICEMLQLPAHAQTMDGEVHLPETFPGNYIWIKSIEISGNKKTREKIITRELDFTLDDSLATTDIEPHPRMFERKRFSRADSSEVVRRLKYSRENIINTKLFLMVDLYLEQVEDFTYRLRIEVQERWYLWVFPVIKLDHPNFNDWLRDPDLSLLSQGLFISENNMWGLSHQGSLVGYFGSSQGIGVGYFIPWIGKGQKIGMRLAGAYRNSAVVEYGSKMNDRQILYEKGSLKEFSLINTFTLRPGLYNYGKIRITASKLLMSDELYNLTLNDSLANFLPGENKSVSYFNLYIEYTYDSRNSHAYPLKGNYLTGFVDKRGLGILSRDVDYFYYGIDFHFYQKLSEKWYTAEMVKLVNSSSQNIPYYFKQDMTSRGNFVRGYDYYALRGDQLYYFRSNLKYQLIKPGIMKARKEKHKDSQFRNLPYAFYLNTFADVCYVAEKFYGDFNSYNNRALYSWGVGLDFITYYDLVLRFEYAFTILGTHGFYFGFGMPI